MTKSDDFPAYDAQLDVIFADAKQKLIDVMTEHGVETYIAGFWLSAELKDGSPKTKGDVPVYTNYRGTHDAGDMVQVMLDSTLKRCGASSDQCDMVFLLVDHLIKDARERAIDGLMAEIDAMMMRGAMTQGAPR